MRDNERAEIARELHTHIDRLAMLSMVLHRIWQSLPGRRFERPAYHKTEPKDR